MAGCLCQQLQAGRLHRCLWLSRAYVARVVPVYTGAMEKVQRHCFSGECLVQQAQQVRIHFPVVSTSHSCTTVAR